MKTSILISLIFTLSNLFAQESEIIFQEDFEASTIQEVITQRDEAKNGTNMSFSGDVPLGSPGSQSSCTHRPW